MREERENCCDDLAVAVCGDPIVYARALADLERFRGSAPELAMAANGGSLLNRIERLIAPRPTGTVTPVGVTALAIVLAATLVWAAQTPAPKAEVSQAQSPRRPASSPNP